MLARRNYLPHMLGLVTLAVFFSAASVHPQTATENAAGATKSASPSAGSSSAATGGADKSAAGAKSAGAGNVSKADANMMRDMAYANISEIEAGKLAQSKSKNEQVLNFAQRMIDDHTKAQGELQQMAQAKGVTLPTEPDTKHKTASKALSKLSGAAFDSSYMKQGGVNDHEQTHKLLTRVKNKATDADLKALADKMMPTVDQHLTMAQEARSSKAAAKSSASGGSGAAGSSASGSAGPTGKPSTSTGK